ncbi:hypothetical protein EUGRSUZ_F01324 [Eucalyptus grandis]|uniref:Uncharacterized protein n=2 Tax=Eucalyptus grandis TaxID=71139 RepID=A0ACC3KEL0_EUCGR|nr:hypothetical protein EUGRSUZ_F01324 [Eucalyptus grandis]
MAETSSFGGWWCSSSLTFTSSTSILSSLHFFSETNSLALSFEARIDWAFGKSADAKLTASSFSSSKKSKNNSSFSTAFSFGGSLNIDILPLIIAVQFCCLMSTV